MSSDMAPTARSSSCRSALRNSRAQASMSASTRVSTCSNSSGMVSCRSAIFLSTALPSEPYRPWKRSSSQQMRRNSGLLASCLHSSISSCGSVSRFEYSPSDTCRSANATVTTCKPARQWRNTHPHNLPLLLLCQRRHAQHGRRRLPLGEGAQHLGAVAIVGRGDEHGHAGGQAAAASECVRAGRGR